MQLVDAVLPAQTSSGSSARGVRLLLSRWAQRNEGEAARQEVLVAGIEANEMLPEQGPAGQTHSADVGLAILGSADLIVAL